MTAPIGLKPYSATLLALGGVILMGLGLYFAFLRPNGVCILSVSDQKRSPQIWSEVEAVLEPIDTLITENARGKWVCKVLKPRS